MRSRRALVVFAKAPGADVKTRLKGCLSDGERIRIYSELLEHTINTVSAIRGTDTFVAGAPRNRIDYFRNRRLRVFHQEGKDIGMRMHHALSTCLDRGYGRVVLVGADIPDLSVQIILSAFAKLRGHDVVLGPARDGGYYLIGVKRNSEGLFEGIEWSTEKVLSQSCERARDLGLSIAFTPKLYDVDTLQDVSRYRMNRSSSFR